MAFVSILLNIQGLHLGIQLGGKLFLFIRVMSIYRR